MGRAGRRAPPQRGGLPEAKRRGRARSRREGLEAELQHLELGAEAAAPTGTGLVQAEEPGESDTPWTELAQRCVRVEGRAATDEELLLVSSPEDERSPGAPPPPQQPDPSRRAVGSLLALLGRALSGDVRNGLALLPPYGSYSPPVDAVAIAARAAQKHPGVQRVLIVDWCALPGRPTPRLFQDDPSVLYFGVHWGSEPPPSVGSGRGEGFTVDLRWEEPGPTDGDYAAAFLQLLLPIALEFQPQLVLVNAAIDAALGDPEGRVGVSPDGIALLTHLLAALAGGCLLLALQGGSQAGAVPGGLSAILRTLLGDPGDPPGPMTPTPSGLGSIARTLEAHRKYWSGLRCEPDVEDEPEDEEGEEEREEPEDEEEVPGGDEGSESDEDPDPPLEPPGGGEGQPPTARTGLLYDERMEEHCNPWDSQHPEAPQRVSRVLQRLRDLGLARRCLHLPARPARRPQLLACHTKAHVAALAATAGLGGPRELRGAAARYNSVFLCPRSYACARLAAGTACAAVTAVMRGQVQNALAVVRPPGHHARPGAAGGFCLFNNVAVAARHAQRLAGGALRVLIVDWDVHHGDGTQQIFEDDPSVLYISLHRHDGSFFPGGAGGAPWRRGRGRGRGFTLNVGWGGPRAGDPDYVAAVTRLVLPVACQFAPQLVLVSAGFDAARGDPLGGCAVSPPTFGLLTHLLGGLAGGRLVLVLEGGYNLGVTAEGVAQCLGVLLGDPPALPPPGPPQPPALRALALTRRAHRGTWACLRLPPPAPGPPAGKATPLADEATPPAGEATPPSAETTPPSDEATPPDDITGGPALAAIMRLGELSLGGAAGGGAGEPPRPHPASRRSWRRGRCSPSPPCRAAPTWGPSPPCPRGGPCRRPPPPAGSAGAAARIGCASAASRWAAGATRGGTCCSMGGPRGTPWRWACATSRPGATPAGPTCTTPCCSPPRLSCTASSSASTPRLFDPPPQNFSVTPPPKKKPHSLRATQVPTPPRPPAPAPRGGDPKKTPPYLQPPPQNPRAPGWAGPGDDLGGGTGAFWPPPPINFRGTLRHGGGGACF